MTSVAKPTPIAVSFESVLEWFERARRKADELGRSDSATLWADGVEHLKYMAAQKNRALTNLEHWRQEVGKLHSQRDTLKAEAAALKEQRDELLEVLEFYATDGNPLYMEEFGLLELGERNHDLQGTRLDGTKARTLIAKAKNLSESQKVVG